MELKAMVVMLSCVAFVPECKSADLIYTNSASGFRYKFLGCFKDDSKERALPNLYFNGREYIDWKAQGWNDTILGMCADHARNFSGLIVFAIQHWGECWGGSKITRYDKHGVSKSCDLGVGSDWTNAVYELISECEVNGVEYKNGQSFFIPHNPIQDNTFGCQSCTCDRGVKLCNARIVCDYFFPCEKFIPAPQGKCCPTCSCQYQGLKYKDGETWINRRRDACFKCTCVEGHSKCKVEHCEMYCPNPIYEPDKCCPACHPGAPTTNRPYIRITETTPRPPPVFPPFPSFPGNHKRIWMLKNKYKRNKQ